MLSLCVGVLSLRVWVGGDRELREFTFAFTSNTQAWAEDSRNHKGEYVHLSPFLPLPSPLVVEDRATTGV
jgi:hypothetical protein